MALLARIASEEAEKGYEVSIGILKDASRELAIDAIAVAERLNMANDDIIVGVLAAYLAQGLCGNPSEAMWLRNCLRP